MGPRGEHNRDEFRALVVEAAERIAHVEGLKGLGMRRLAAEIGYAPNSIYHAVGDLDDVILLVNARTLSRLETHLAAAAGARPGGRERILGLADAYFDFVFAEPRLWSLLFEHGLPAGRDVSDDYRAALARPIALVADAFAPLVADPKARARLVAGLWAALHGLASLAAAGKLGLVTDAEPAALGRLVLGHVLAGLGREAAEENDTGA